MTTTSVLSRSTFRDGEDLEYIDEGDAIQNVSAFRGELVAITKGKSSFDGERELAMFVFGNIDKAVDDEGVILDVSTYYIRMKLTAHKDGHLRAFLASVYPHLSGGREMTSLNEALSAMRSLIGTPSEFHCRSEKRDYSQYDTGLVTVGRCWMVEDVIVQHNRR